MSARRRWATTIWKRCRWRRRYRRGDIGVCVAVYCIVHIIVEEPLMHCFSSSSKWSTTPDA